MPAQKRLDRFQKILGLIQSNCGASLEELAAELGVSEMTVRRDLEDLARDGAVHLIHTGALLPRGPGSRHEGRRPRGAAGSAGEADLARIGRKAASLVNPGDTIIVDAGPAGEWLMRCIPPGTALTVICFSMGVLLEARRREGTSIVVAGGALRGDTLAFESPEAVSLLRRHRANKAFLSAAGVSDRLGVTCSGSAEAEMKQAAVASSQTRILLAGAEAFGRVAPAWCAHLADFDVIVTDPGVSLEYVEIARSLGIALHVA
jgi:DeoR family transcriptional regulator, deoxyribose operon repressor